MSFSRALWHVIRFMISIDFQQKDTMGSTVKFLLAWAAPTVHPELAGALEPHPVVRREATWAASKQQAWLCFAQGSSTVPSSVSSLFVTAILQMAWPSPPHPCKSLRALPRGQRWLPALVVRLSFHLESHYSSVEATPLKCKTGKGGKSPGVMEATRQDLYHPLKHSVLFQ